MWWKDGLGADGVSKELDLQMLGNLACAAYNLVISSHIFSRSAETPSKSARYPVSCARFKYTGGTTDFH